MRYRSNPATFRTIPAMAPIHTAMSRLTPHQPSSASRHTGVYVPAISTKIIEWSSRRITGRTRGPRANTWYDELTR